jgi:hypothetical protein
MQRFERFLKTRSVLPLRWFTEWSHFYRFINFRLTEDALESFVASRLGKNLAEEWGPGLSSTGDGIPGLSPPSPRERDLLRANLTRMKEALRGRCPLTVIIFPAREQLEQQPFPIQEQLWLKDMLEDLEIPYLDLLEVFSQHGGPQLFLDLWHLNPTGHEVTAKALYEFILEHGLLGVRK